MTAIDSPANFCGAGTPRADPRDLFARYVQQCLDGPVLRYSHRLELLREAGRRGIGRFEANLVIASVLHREGMSQELEMKPVSSGWVVRSLMTYLVVQGLIIAGAWWVLR